VKYKHLFGPVISRRLGISLGVDVVPYKYCSMDCVYCEVGKTTHLLDKPENFVDFNELISELDSFISENPKLDYITFSGAGEPLLYSRIGEVINYVKENYSQYKLALITNSTHLNRKDIQDELMKLDMVMPSMDATDNATFKLINRPASTIDIDSVITNLAKFSAKFPGVVWLEIFFIPGLNDSDEILKDMKSKIELIKPDRVQLNSLDRPGTEPWVVQEDFEKLEKIKDYFQEGIKDIEIEIIKKVNKELFDQNVDSVETQDKILTTISRRPCTAQDLSQMLNLHINAINKVLHELISIGYIEGIRQDRGVFYQLRSIGCS